MSLAVKASRMTTQGAGRPRGKQGDPGLLGGILGGIGGFLTGGPAGAIAGAVGGWKSGGSSAPPGTGLMAPPPRTGFPQVPTPGIRGAAQRFLPGGETGYTSTGCPSGYRPNKTSYFLKDGTFVPAGSKCVKVRRRNAMNPKALSRAMSRISMAKNAAKKLSRVTIRKATSCR